MTALNSGAVDLVMRLTVARTQNLSDQYTVLEGTMNLVQALYLNNAEKPLDDVRVRQALCYAVDVDSILELTADGHGTKLGSSMYPAFTKYFDDSLTDYYSYDPEKAKTLLAEAGYPNGFAMTITVALQLCLMWMWRRCWWSSSLLWASRPSCRRLSGIPGCRMSIRTGSSSPRWWVLMREPDG